MEQHKSQGRPTFQNYLKPKIHFHSHDKSNPIYISNEFNNTTINDNTKPSNRAATE